MDDGDGTVGMGGAGPLSAAGVAPPFIAPDILNGADLRGARNTLSSIVHSRIMPRLMRMQADDTGHPGQAFDGPTGGDIARLAHLVLDPNIQLSAEFVVELKERGLSMDKLFVDLLEPAARCLGAMWDEDECSFVDVTLGVGRLQQLLSMFSCSNTVPSFSQKRRVCMITIAEEKHSFGVTMVEKFLRAGGWDVRSERGAMLQQIAPLVRRSWFAVVGLTASSDKQLDALAAAVHQVRQHSCNPVVGIMVGGPPFCESPDLAARVGADATAVNAPAAVLLAQRLFDLGAQSNWQDSFIDTRNPDGATRRGALI